MAGNRPLQSKKKGSSDSESNEKRRYRMSKPNVMVVAPSGGVIPPLEMILEEAHPVVVQTADEFLQARKDVEIMFLNDFRSTLIRDYGPGDLKWIHTSSIGVDSLLTPEMLGSELVVTNSRGVCERPIAEWVLGVILMFTKDLRKTLELQVERIWLHRETESLLDRHALVVGPGPVGREIVKLLRAAGMRVTVVGRSERVDHELGPILSVRDLPGALSSADDVILALPHSPETQGLFNAEMLSRMASGARLVNVGRGAVLVESDLISALDSGHLGGAALDVFEREPLPAESPLWGYANVLISPHASGDLIGWRARVVESFVTNLKRWKNNQELLDVVDFRAMGTLP